VVRDNRISSVVTAIDVEWRYDGVGSSRNRFLGNTVRSAKRGIFIEVGNDGNRVERNLFLNVITPVVFQGSSNNIAIGNRACGNRGVVVIESEGWRDNGTLARSTGNHLANNVSRSCAKLVPRK
jgi:parallel beta-helix repeat protein